MKIISRPEDMPVGEGPYILKMTAEELQYIGALLWNTRLGEGIYQEAAFKLTNTIEELFGEDFMQDASECVDFSMTIEDNRGNVLEQHHHSTITIEV